MSAAGVISALDWEVGELLVRTPTGKQARQARSEACGERTLAEGRMHDSGLQSGLTAQVTGAWAEMNAVDDLVIPDDVNAAQSSRISSHGKQGVRTPAPDLFQ